MIINKAAQSGKINIPLAKSSKKTSENTELNKIDLVSISACPEKKEDIPTGQTPPVITEEKTLPQTKDKSAPSDNLTPGPAKGTYAQLEEPLKTAEITSVKDDDLRKAKLNSREYKMLLHPQNFGNPKEGMNRFWDAVKKAGEKEGFEVEDASSHEMEPPRYVTYLDTQDFSLNKLGYILRQRQNSEIKSDNEDDRGKKYELSLKYRNSDMNISASKDVSVAEGLEGKSKFEEDVVAGKENVRRIYAPSVKTVLKEKIGNTLEDYGEIFPALKDLGLSGKSCLEKVNDRRIEEDKMDLGEIKFENGVTAEASISVWYNQGDGDRGIPIIGEFSFHYDVNKGEDTAPYSDRLLKAIQKSTGSWIADNVTKTELIYGNKEGDDL